MTSPCGFGYRGDRPTSRREPADRLLLHGVPEIKLSRADPPRASHSWPSMLDNTVAGGITAGDLPRMSILRECAEEASLDPEFVARRIRQTGSVTYNYRTKEGWLQPEVQYCFDLRLPDPESEKTGDREGVVPTTNPADGEVESFALMTVEEVVERLLAGEFKPNCALCVRFSPSCCPGQPGQRAAELTDVFLAASCSTFSSGTGT